MIRLIVSDIDATLINSEFKIPDYNIEMIKKAADAGIDFMLCTGRLFGSARPYAKHLGLSTPIVTSNGAVTIDWQTKESLFARSLAPEVCVELFDVLDELDLYYHVYTKEAFYTRKFLFEGMYIKKMTQGLPEEEKFPIVETENLREIVWEDPAYKISVRCHTPEEVDKFNAAMEGRNNISITSSMAENYEISALGVNKGAAVKQYAELKGIKPEEIMTFGDNYNDIEMTRYAGIGVAVGNAVEALKEAADFITDTNENCGVGKAIARFVFEEQEG